MDLGRAGEAWRGSQGAMTLTALGSRSVDPRGVTQRRWQGDGCTLTHANLQRSWADRSPGGCCHLVPVEFRRTALWIALPQPAGPQTWLALAFELSANASPAANHINVLGHSARCQLYLPVLCWSNLGKRTLHPGSSSGRFLLVRTP